MLQSDEVKTEFVMPGNPEKDVYLLPVSGGADSSALAILLHEMFPNIPFQMCHTDTKADEPEIYSTLDALEVYLGKPITRITPEAGLFQQVEEYKGFLPGHSARWCTKNLKLLPFKNWISQFAGRRKLMFVGIRSDEATRLAFTLDEVETIMPFIDLGVKREEVFAILERTIGIPAFYRRRTRSGCTVCFYQRRSELVGLLTEKPVEFERGSRYEKLAPEDARRHSEAAPLWKDSGIAANWQSLPVPGPEGSISGRRPSRNGDLFGNRGLFIGAEFFMDGLLTRDEFIWHQRVVSYSPTLAGIRSQLDDRYRHLLATGEVFGMSPDDVRAQARFAIWYIELPDDVFDPDPPKGPGYTWQQGASYRQLRHIIQWATRVLHAEWMRQVASWKAPLLSVQYEWAEASQNGLARIQDEVGNVVASEWYKPSEIEPVLDEEQELALLPCPMCHI